MCFVCQQRLWLLLTMIIMSGIPPDCLMIKTMLVSDAQQEMILRIQKCFHVFSMYMPLYSSQAWSPINATTSATYIYLCLTLANHHFVYPLIIPSTLQYTAAPAMWSITLEQQAPKQIHRSCACRAARPGGCKHCSSSCTQQQFLTLTSASPTGGQNTPIQMSESLIIS